MIVKKENPATPDNPRSVDFNFTNGDLKALEEVKTKWRFKDEQDLIRFALAVMLKADNNKLTVDQGGSKTGLSPADNLLEGSES